jgi:hypothetical protein
MESTSKDQGKQSVDLSKALYLGLLVSDEYEAILSYLTNALAQFYELYPNVKDLKNLISNLENKTFEDEGVYLYPWRYPKENKHWHVTTLFKKGKTFLKTQPSFKAFEEGKDQIIRIHAMVYVPEKIITSVVFTDTPVENEFPHMTTLVGQYAPKNSNDVCQALFSKGKIFEKEYYKLSKSEERTEDEIFREEITLLNKKETVYVIFFQSPVEFNTKMNVFYK